MRDEGDFVAYAEARASTFSTLAILCHEAYSLASVTWVRSR